MTWRILPGFTAGDQSTLILRRYLSRLNYQTLPWKLGQNTGSYDLQDRLLDRFEQVLEDHPGKISLVGQSLGGIGCWVQAQRPAAEETRP